MLIDEVPMNRFILSRPGSIVALLLAALAISGCDCNPNPSPYGGPYRIGGDTRNIDAIMANNKNAEFAAFKQKQWNSSIVRELDDSTPDDNRRLFENSIKANSSSNVPDATEFQRYNYVIKGRKIHFAVWKDNNTDLNNICKPGMPYRPNTSTRMIIEPNTMVNFYSEEPNDKLSSYPDCISIVGSNKKTGVLDAHSKHFMLAQGTGIAISDYDPTKGWEEMAVDYAGEIIIILKGNPCYYVINQGSGTYKPKPGRSNSDFEYLITVATLFEQVLGVRPAFVERTNPNAYWYLGPQNSALSCT
jgi:hypothetical protein